LRADARVSRLLPDTARGLRDLRSPRAALALAVARAGFAAVVSALHPRLRARGRGRRRAGARPRLAPAQRLRPDRDLPAPRLRPRAKAAARPRRRPSRAHQPRPRPIPVHPRAADFMGRIEPALSVARRLPLDCATALKPFVVSCAAMISLLVSSLLA